MLQTRRQDDGRPASAEEAGRTSGCLVIGFGNELRGDDGLGPLVARRLAECALPGVEILVCHQLTPELVTELEGRAIVVFVDASTRLDVPPVQLRVLGPQDGFALGHHYSPSTLLALAASLHMEMPPAYLMEVQGYSFDYGTAVTDRARRHVDAAVEALRRLLREEGCLA